MAQADIFSQLNNPVRGRNFAQQAQAAGISQQRLNRDVQRLLQDETAILNVKKQMLKLDVKQHGLFKAMGKMMQNMTKKNDEYLKNKKNTLKFEKELAKIQKQYQKVARNGRNANSAEAKFLKKKKEEMEYQLRMQRMQLDQQRRSLPLSGKLSGHLGMISKGAKITTGIFESMYSTLGNITGLIDMLLTPFKLMGQILMKPFQTFLEIQNITGNLAADIGLTNKESYKLKDTFADLAIGSLKFGGTMEDVATAMRVFSQETGKNRFFDRGNIESLVKLAYATGLGVEGAMEMATMFDKMGYSLEKGIELTEDARKVAAKYNLNNTKLLQNMGAFTKQLNGYEFKSGLENLTKIVAKAQSLRYDLGGIKGIADSLFDPEGAIEASAQLQVLGGRFSAISDPFGLMYAAQNAPEQLADAMMNMTKGMARKGANGNFFISAADRKMIQQAASALGADADNLINAAIEQGKLADKLSANPILKKGIFDDDQLQALGNLVSLKNGKYVIRMPDGFDQLLSDIPTKAVFQQILDERKKNEQAAIERKNWSQRFSLILERFMIGFSTPFTKLEGIFNNTDLFGKIEALGTTIADKIVPWIQNAFSPNGQVFKIIDGVGAGLSRVLDEVKSFFDNSNKPFLTTLKDGMISLFSKVVDVVVPYLKYGFGALLASLGSLPLVGSSLASKGHEMMLSGARSSSGVAKISGITSGQGQKDFQRSMMEAYKNDDTSTGTYMGYTALGATLGSILPGIGTIAGALGGAAVGFIAAAIQDNVEASPEQRYAKQYKVNDGIVTPNGDVVKYPKGELLSIMAPQQSVNDSASGGGNLVLSGTIRLETPAGNTNLTLDDFRRAGIHLIANAIGHEQTKTDKGYGLNDSKDIKTKLAI